MKYERIELIAFVMVIQMLVSLILAVLKLTFFPAISWIVVAIPIFSPFLLCLFSCTLLLVFMVLFGWIKDKKEKRSMYTEAPSADVTESL